MWDDCAERHPHYDPPRTSYDQRNAHNQPRLMPITFLQVWFVGRRAKIHPQPNKITNDQKTHGTAKLNPPVSIAPRTTKGIAVKPTPMSETFNGNRRAWPCRTPTDYVPNSDRDIGLPGPLGRAG